MHGLSRAVGFWEHMDGRETQADPHRTPRSDALRRSAPARDQTATRGFRWRHTPAAQRGDLAWGCVGLLACGAIRSTRPWTRRRSRSCAPAAPASKTTAKSAAHLRAPRRRDVPRPDRAETSAMCGSRTQAPRVARRPLFPRSKRLATTGPEAKKGGTPGLAPFRLACAQSPRQARQGMAGPSRSSYLASSSSAGRAGASPSRPREACQRPLAASPRARLPGPVA